MRDSRPPFRAAFWAISASLVLMLLLTLSDPYQIRKSILARHSSAPSPANAAEVEADRQPTDVGPRRSQERIAAAASPQSALETSASTTDSNQSERRVGTSPAGLPAIPVVGPGEFPGPSEPGRFEELPPPGQEPGPANTIDAPLAKNAANNSGFPDDRSVAALERLQLETEILTLRNDLRILADSQQIDQSRHLQEQQSLLLDRQEQTADRIDQLIDSQPIDQCQHLQQQQSLLFDQQQQTVERITQLIDSQPFDQSRHLQEQQSLLLDRQQQAVNRIEQMADQIASQSAKLEQLLEEASTLHSQRTSEAGRSTSPALPAETHFAPMPGRPAQPLHFECEDWTP